MTDINREDEGWYICSATNSAGSNEARVHLDVMEVPGFIRPQGMKICEEKFNSHLKLCTALN